MTSQLLVLTSEGVNDTGDFTVRFQPAIRLGNVPHECRLTNANVYNSWHNIRAGLDNQLFRYYNGTIWTNITFDAGSYSVQSFQEELQKKLIAEGDAVETDGVYSYDINFSLDEHNGYVDLVLTNGFQVDFSVSSLNELFGFSSINYAATATGPNPADLTGGISSLLVHFSPVMGASRVNNNSSDVLYVLNSAQTAPLGLITVEPGEDFLPMSAGSELSSARVWISDENLNPVAMNGSNVSLTVFIRPMK